MPIHHEEQFPVSTITRPAPTENVPTTQHSALYSSLIGLAALGVLLHAVWAALFIHEGQDNDRARSSRYTPVAPRSPSRWPG